jgi:hypothetical protein
MKKIIFILITIISIGFCFTEKNILIIGNVINTPTSWLLQTTSSLAPQKIVVKNTLNANSLNDISISNYSHIILIISDKSMTDVKSYEKSMDIHFSFLLMCKKLNYKVKCIVVQYESIYKKYSQTVRVSRYVDDHIIIRSFQDEFTISKQIYDAIN